LIWEGRERGDGGKRGGRESVEKGRNL